MVTKVRKSRCKTDDHPRNWLVGVHTYKDKGVSSRNILVRARFLSNEIILKKPVSHVVDDSEEDQGE